MHDVISNVYTICKNHENMKIVLWLKIQNIFNSNVLNLKIEYQIPHWKSEFFLAEIHLFEGNNVNKICEN